jgi:hypothetical protein
LYITDFEPDADPLMTPCEHFNKDCVSNVTPNIFNVPSVFVHDSIDSISVSTHTCNSSNQVCNCNDNVNDCIFHHVITEVSGLVNTNSDNIMDNINGDEGEFSQIVHTNSEVYDGNIVFNMPSEFVDTNLF